MGDESVLLISFAVVCSDLFGQWAVDGAICCSNTLFAAAGLVCDVNPALRVESLGLCKVVQRGILSSFEFIPSTYSILFWSCSFTQAMLELHGPALLATVTTLTSLGFLMIGYDNGLLGGLGMFEFPPMWREIAVGAIKLNR